MSNKIVIFIIVAILLIFFVTVVFIPQDFWVNLSMNLFK